jgi:hypothetical protein
MSAQKTRFPGLLVVAITASMVLPGAVTAQVHVDPGGPAGKQYSDSLDQARVDNGDGDKAAAVPGATAEAPSFGAGVTPPDDGGPGAGQPKAADDPKPAGGSKAADESAEAPAVETSGGGDGPLVAGLVVGGLLLAGLVGFGMRRFTSSSA